MPNVLIINAHHNYPFSKGRVNNTLVNMATEHLESKGHVVRNVKVDDQWDVKQELENHQWADIVLLQTPVNWMGVPWTYTCSYFTVRQSRSTKTLSRQAPLPSMLPEESSEDFSSRLLGALMELPDGRVWLRALELFAEKAAAANK